MAESQTVAAAPVRRASAQRKRARKTQALVVVGNGMVSHKLCERLANLDAYKITVFGEEHRPAYDRVHLTGFLEGRSSEQLQLASKEWYAGNGIELHLGDPIIAIDRAARKVRAASGRETVYDQLVLATGSRAFVPPIPGVDLEGVFVYRTLDDLARIKAYAPKCRRAAVLGGGLLGLEAARALQGLGLDTWVVERGSSLLARQLEPKAGAILQGHVEKLGLRVCSQRQSERIEAIGDDRLLQFNTGECLRVQLVVVAAGIRPRDELAAECGLELGPRGGVRVDDFLRTSDPNIFAIGECASHNGVCYGLAAPGYKMADVLAANLSGRRSRFTGSDQSTRLKLSGIEVATLGEFQAEGDETLSWNGPEGYRRIVLERGRLVGATAVGLWTEAGRAQELIERRARVWRWQRRRFSDTGRLWKGETGLHIAQWPASAMVCNCTGVRRGALTAACSEGCATVEQLARRTGASTVCGSCKPLLAELLGAPASMQPLAGLKALAIACAVAVALALVILFAAPIPFADSVQSSLRQLDRIWRTAAWKQSTGFTLVGLALISLVLSFRKRLKKFTWGEFGNWRALHATLGAVSLIALVTHTGMRLGQNLNLVLMMNFLALALAGAAAGGVTALERRLGARAAKRLRSFWTATHIAIAWPLPVLVVFHIVMAYYF